MSSKVACVIFCLTIAFQIANSQKITTNMNEYKELMRQIFIQQLGEPLRRKLEMIANEGVHLGKSNKEIDDMVRARLTKEEKIRFKKAFEAIAGPMKDAAREKIKGTPPKRRRTSDFYPNNPAYSKSKTKNSTSSKTKTEL